MIWRRCCVSGVAVIVKKAKTELEEIRLRQRAVTERLIGGYKAVLEQLAPDGVTTATEAAAVTMAHQALLTLSGVAEPGGERREGSGPVPEDGGSPARCGWWERRARRWCRWCAR